MLEDDGRPPRWSPVLAALLVLNVVGLAVWWAVRH
jgi:hypothetical protein